jgi:hypothetical protein
MYADMAFGGYRILRPLGNFGDPMWPDKTFSELLALGFKDRVIDSDTHPVVKQVLGIL